ncbi:ATP-binding cassette domain-containing protein, partial [Nonomuraea sp. NPDC055795]
MNGGGVEVEGLRKVFGGKTAVDEVSFTVEPGAVVGLLGPNGAGKTTVINCLSTLLPLDGGRASVAGHDVAGDPSGVRASIALTGQFAAVDDVLTGRQNLVLFGRLLKLGKAAA